MSSNVVCISDVRRIYNGLYSQIRLIWAEGLQDPNQIYSSCTTRSPHATMTQLKAGGLRVQRGRTTVRSETYIYSLVKFARAFTCIPYPFQLSVEGLGVNTLS